MTVYKGANIPKWAQKVEAIANAILKQATNDMLNSIDVVAGINRGGSRVRGTIPRDLGTLAASLQSSLRGSTALTGEKSYQMVVGQIKVGDRAEFVWGGNAAPYARAVHYGTRNTAGTFWVDVAVNGWRGYVRRATVKAKATIR